MMWGMATLKIAEFKTVIEAGARGISDTIILCSKWSTGRTVGYFTRVVANHF